MNSSTKYQTAKSRDIFNKKAPIWQKVWLLVPLLFLLNQAPAQNGYIGVWHSGQATTYWRHNLSFSAFNSAVNSSFKKGYHLMDVEIKNGRYSGIFKKRRGGLYWHTGMSSKAFNDKVNAYFKKGLYLVDLEIVNGKYTGIFQTTGMKTYWRNQLTFNAFNAAVNSFFKNGYHLIDVEITNGRYSGIFQKSSGGLYWHTGMNFSAFSRQVGSYVRRGYRLIDVEIVNGKYTGIFKKQSGAMWWWAGLCYEDFNAKVNTYHKQKRYPVDIEFSPPPCYSDKTPKDCYTSPKVSSWHLVTEWDYDNKDWTDLCQGVATDGHHWYFSSNSDGDRAIYKYTHGMQRLAKARVEKYGSKHVGDLAYYKHAIYVALEQPARMLMMTKDLRGARLIEFHPSSRPPREEFPWVAVNPNNGYFYSSAFTNPTEVRYYEERNNQLHLVGTVPLKHPINKVQGGDISPNCKLVLSSDASNDIKCYNVNTGDYYGRESIQKDDSWNVQEEIEGLCISPGSDIISGKKMDIHLILLDQDYPDGDDVIFKHIAVPSNIKL